MAKNDDLLENALQTINNLLHVIAQGTYTTKGADFETVGAVLGQARTVAAVIEGELKEEGDDE